MIARAAEVDGVIGKRTSKPIVVDAAAVASNEDAVISRAVDTGVMNIAVGAVELDDGIAARPSIDSAANLPVRVVVLPQRRRALAQLPAGVAADRAVHELVVLVVVAKADDAAAIGVVGHQAAGEAVVRGIVFQAHSVVTAAADTIPYPQAGKDVVAGRNRLEGSAASGAGLVDIHIGKGSIGHGT